MLQEKIYDRTENEDVGGRILRGICPNSLKKDYDQLMNSMWKRENNQRIRMMKKDSGKIRLLKRDVNGQRQLLKRDLDGRIRMFT